MLNDEMVKKMKYKYSKIYFIFPPKLRLVHVGIFCCLRTVMLKKCILKITHINLETYIITVKPELTACCWGIEHFSVYLKGHKFTLYTDHKPLEKLSIVHTKTLNRLQQIMNE